MYDRSMHDRDNPAFTEDTYRKVFNLILEVDKPVQAQDLVREVDDGPSSREFEGLGPRPRRKHLFTVLRDLRDEGLIISAEAGIDLPREPHSDIDKAIGNFTMRGLIQQTDQRGLQESL